ncbi:hypothetical protein L6R52_09645 [Myxococcota bacterium]|nr:hypothetical protein [Myxococcota bacterium]
MNLSVLAGAGLVRVLVLTSIDDAPARAADVRARVDAVVTLHAAIEVRTPGRGCVVYTTAPRVESACARRDPPAGLDVAWSKIEAGQGAYDNVPGGTFELAPIDWVASPWTRGWSVRADVAPIVRASLARRWDVRLNRAGTMRFVAEVTLSDGTVLRSERPIDALRGGPPSARDARKVSLRLDDGYLGMMSELGGVPYIFGSTATGREPHQAERAIGVDCADLVIYGLRRLGHDVAYRSSRTLGPISTRVVRGPVRRVGARYVDPTGQPISVGASGVAPGDWVIFSGHVAAFFEDRGARGVLDDEDLVIHTVWREVAVEPLHATGYADSPFEVRRSSDLQRSPRR